jgi:hypothetical protein
LEGTRDSQPDGLAQRNDNGCNDKYEEGHDIYSLYAISSVSVWAERSYYTTYFATLYFT